MTTPEPPYTVVRSSAELSVDDPRIVWPVGEVFSRAITWGVAKADVILDVWDAGGFDVRLRAPGALSEVACEGCESRDATLPSMHTCQRYRPRAAAPSPGDAEALLDALIARSVGGSVNGIEVIRLVSLGDIKDVLARFSVRLK